MHIENGVINENADKKYFASIPDEVFIKQGFKIGGYIDEKILSAALTDINNYKAIMAYKKKMLEDVRNRQDSYNSDKIVNAYGKASILMLMGSILITLGVIITIIMISKG